VYHEHNLCSIYLHHTGRAQRHELSIAWHDSANPIGKIDPVLNLSGDALHYLTYSTRNMHDKLSTAFCIVDICKLSSLECMASVSLPYT